MTMDNREVTDALLQRTRPDTIGEEYSGPPEQSPPGPTGGTHLFYAKIIDGRTVGQADRYYMDDGPVRILGYWIDEVVGAGSDYPSRTRKADGTYIPSVWSAPSVGNHEVVSQSPKTFSPTRLCQAAGIALCPA